MTAACRLDGCTVHQTGVCALENDASTCPNRNQEVALSLPRSDTAPNVTIAVEGQSAADVGAAVLDTPEKNPNFPPSGALGLETVNEMMASRYGTIVGIVGDPESGKTACLVSLYLLVSHAKLRGWSFADSRSLMAFEEIARGARRWQDGQPPDQLTVHTELSDDRQPGFLHLRLRRNESGRPIDLFLPDLPGEWTKDLIKNDITERFEFIKSADVIWVMTDGRALINREGRQGIIHRIDLLVGRLAKLFEKRLPRLILVTTHRDHGDVPEVAIDQIRKGVAKFGFPFEVIPVASFSNDRNAVPPGFGLAELIDSTAVAAPESVPFRRPAPVAVGARAFLSYRRFE